MPHSDPLRRPLTWLAVAGSLAVPWAVGAGCQSNTGGEPVSIELSFQTNGAARTFESRTGWTVELEEASIALGAAYFNQNPSLLARVGQALLPSAHAHPGHDFFAGGEVRAEWLGQVVFDTLAGPRRIRDVPGIAGGVRSWTLLVEPPRPGVDEANALRGYRAYVVGTASRDGQTIAFEGGLETLDEQQSDTGGVRFEGLPIDVELTSATTIEVDVDPQVWLDEADFERLLDEDGNCLETSEAGRCFILGDSQVHNAWVLGMTTRQAFQASDGGAS